MATLPVVFDYVMNEFNFVLVFYYFYKTTPDKWLENCIDSFSDLFMLF